MQKESKDLIRPRACLNTSKDNNLSFLVSYWNKTLFILTGLTSEHAVVKYTIGFLST
jgi:hypothetical protein